MGRTIVITAGGVRAEGQLNDSACAAAILKALPIHARASMWGDEVYFAIPVQSPLAQDAREGMEVGELAYWPPGRAFCIFFGATPASDDSGRPRAASEVNPIGRIIGDAAVFKMVRDGQPVTIELAQTEEKTT